MSASRMSGSTRRHRSKRRLAVAIAAGTLCLALACTPSDIRVTADERNPPLNLSALHETGIAPMSTNLDAAQKLVITRSCVDLGVDYSTRLHQYFRRSRIFTFVIAPAIALLFGAVAAVIYWRLLARRRKVGWIPILWCGGLACAAGAVAAGAMHALVVLPQLSRAVAAHRSFAALAREGWIPASAEDAQRDFTANCSDRIADVVEGAREGHDGLKQYRTLFRTDETNPPKEADFNLYSTVIQNRARDLLDLYAVDSGFGKSGVRALSWNDVTAQNSRFEIATGEQGGWWVHSSAHPAAILIVAFGIPLTAWLILFLLSRRVSAAVAHSIKKSHEKRPVAVTQQGA